MATQWYNLVDKKCKNTKGGTIMKGLKKILSIVIAMAVLITVFPMTVAYAGGDEYELSLDSPYNMWIDSNGETVKFSPQNDGWYSFYTNGQYDTYATLYNSNWDFIAENDDSLDCHNFTINYKLYSGYTYYLTVNAYLDTEETAQFELIAKEIVGVEEVQITKEPDNTTVIEGFEKYTYDCSGLEATFTLSDETTVDWTYNEDEYVNGQFVDITFNNDGLGHYYIDITCGDAFTRFFFTTIENPVDYIVYNGDDFTFYENSHGYYSEYEEQYYYVYTLSNDSTITIYYKDGTFLQAHPYENVNMFSFETYDNQHETPWTVDDNNFFTLCYLGVSTQVPVTILPCPFKSVTVNSAPSREYIYGDYEYGSMVGSEYHLYPSDLTGLSFTVTYEDGTTETFDDSDINTDKNQIDGYMYHLSAVLPTPNSSKEVTLNYKGYDIKYNINVVEIPVKSIEILEDCYQTDYEEYFSPIFDGMKIKISYNDGTSQEVTLNEENTEYIFKGDSMYAVTVGDNTLYIYYNYEDELGDHYVLRYLGAEVPYLNIYTFPLKDIDHLTLDKLTNNGDGTEVTINYTDGTEESITLDVVAEYNIAKEDYYCYALTSKGVVQYSIMDKYENDELVGRNLHILGQKVFIPKPEFTLGDVNADDKINILDATLVQRASAKLMTLTDTQTKASDVDKDGKITILDVTKIQRYVAKVISEF